MLYLFVVCFFFVYSKFTLIINQNQAVLSLHENDDRSKFFPLLHVPTKAIDDFSNLSDIHASVKNLNGQYVNVRAVVRDVTTIIIFFVCVCTTCMFSTRLNSINLCAIHRRIRRL